MSWWVYVITALALWNIFTFSLYGIDKRKARKEKWRVRERTLILCAFLMGGVGAFLGIYIFRHKIRRLKFKLLIPLAIFVNAGTAALVMIFIRL